VRWFVVITPIPIARRIALPARSQRIFDTPRRVFLATRAGRGAILQTGEQNQTRSRASNQKSGLLELDHGNESAFPESQAFAQAKGPHRPRKVQKPAPEAMHARR
jgi:hypothetical protein